MDLESIIQNIIGSLIAYCIIRIGKYMISSDKYHASYKLAKRVYIFGFGFLFIFFGFSLFRSEGAEKIIPIVFLIISTIVALYTIIKKPYKESIISVAGLDNELSLEIDYNLKSLQDFWEKLQGLSNKPLSVSEGFRRITQVVIDQSPIKTAEIGSMESGVIPNWHRKIFNMQKFLNSLSNNKQQNIRQLYDNLDTIASTYGRIIKLGDKVVGMLRFK